MRRILLAGKTRKGKNRIHELGEAWLVEKEVATVGFAPGEPGPWLSIFPESCRTNCKSTLCNHGRWVHEHNDADFTVASAGEVVDDTAVKCLVERITGE